MSKRVAVTKLREFPCQIRPVEKDDLRYQQLVASVERYGVLEPLTVVKANDPTTGQLIYGIVHGLQRYHAACDAGATDVPAWIAEMTDEEIQIAQLISAIHKIDVKPVQVSRAMMYIMGRYPVITLHEMAEKICKSLEYVSERLAISRRLGREAWDLVDKGKICLANAYVLAKLNPVTEQYPFVDKALAMSPVEFSGIINARYKQLRDAERAVRKFEPISIKVLKPSDFKAGPREIELGILYQYVGAGVVKIEDGHYRFAASAGTDMAAKIKIKVVK